MIKRNLVTELLMVVVILLILGGCYSFGKKLVHDPVDLKKPEILIKPIYPGSDRARLAVLYFFAPPYAAGAADVLTAAYSQELVRSGLFRQVAVVRQVTPENMDILDVSSAPAKDYDLVLRGKIVYLLAGTGAALTQLSVEVQVVDISKRVLQWYVKQQASSKPGPDVEAIWYSIPGEPAVPYQTLAAALAKQFAETIKPSEREKLQAPVRSPFTGDKKAP